MEPREETGERGEGKMRPAGLRNRKWKGGSQNVGGKKNGCKKRNANWLVDN